MSTPRTRPASRPARCRRAATVALRGPQAHVAPCGLIERNRQLGLDQVVHTRGGAPTGPGTHRRGPPIARDLRGDGIDLSAPSAFTRAARRGGRAAEHTPAARRRAPAALGRASRRRRRRRPARRGRDRRHRRAAECVEEWWRALHGAHTVERCLLGRREATRGWVNRCWGTILMEIRRELRSGGSMGCGINGTWCALVSLWR